MCLKNEAHPVLAGFKTAVREVLSASIPLFLSIARRAELERLALEQAHIQEEAAQAWAHEQVLGTLEAVHVRHAYESFGAVLWCAGADVDESPYLPRNTTESAFEGLLANTTALARADDDDGDADPNHDDDLSIEFEYDDIVGYVDDYRCAKSRRRAAHGAPRQVCTETAWVKGEKRTAKVSKHARQQKQAVVVGTRQSLADSRALRALRRSSRTKR